MVKAVEITEGWGFKVAEGRVQYKEIEFVCANPEFCDATDPVKQQQLYKALTKIPGVIALYQDQSEYSEGQMSLSAIFKDPQVKKQILQTAKQFGVAVDLVQPVDDDYVDRAIRGEHYGQIQGVAEGFSNDMSTEDMIAYLRQHHDKNLHPDYTNHLTSTNSKFVLKNIPINSIKTELSGLDRAKVEQYKQMDFGKAPPIVVGSDGNILDGYHRATVAKALGIPTIKAYVGVKGQQGVAENFADGKVKGRSRPGRVKRAGASCAGSVTDLRAKAKKYSGEKSKMYHWCANMKGGKK